MGSIEVQGTTRLRAALLMFAATVLAVTPQRAPAAETVTVFLLDQHYNPQVRLNKVAPLGEPLRAILAMYALQDGGGCEGNTDPSENGLHCILTTALGVGPQCSAAQLQLVRAWFKTSIPRMSGLAPDIYLNVQRPGTLENICYAAPMTATFQQTWDRIRVRQDGTEIFVDAVGSWLSRGTTGGFHYRTTYKVDDHSITTLSHEEIPMKSQNKSKDEDEE
jgi:hypothetical protein